ncbi:hypothetical protein BDZ91DRAFT_762652 [Kalaharituber pfeilii]|nr:hypothetical protein BDZ91DRAFT_762652 [Kalaharituber pfeilii]
MHARIKLPNATYPLDWLGPNFSARKLLQRLGEEGHELACADACAEHVQSMLYNADMLLNVPDILLRTRDRVKIGSGEEGSRRKSVDNERKPGAAWLRMPCYFVCIVEHGVDVVNVGIYHGKLSWVKSKFTMHYLSAISIIGVWPMEAWRLALDVSDSWKVLLEMRVWGARCAYQFLTYRGKGGTGGIYVFFLLLSLSNVLERKFFVCAGLSVLWIFIAGQGSFCDVLPFAWWLMEKKTKIRFGYAIRDLAICAGRFAHMFKVLDRVIPLFYMRLFPVEVDIPMGKVHAGVFMETSFVRVLACDGQFTRQDVQYICRGVNHEVGWGG